MRRIALIALPEVLHISERLGQEVVLKVILRTAFQSSWVQEWKTSEGILYNRITHMLPFTTSLVRRANAPELCACRFSLPCGTSGGRLVCRYMDIVLLKPTEHLVGIHGQAICSGLDTRDFNVAVRVNLGPVLVRLGIEDIVLKWIAIGGEYGEGTLRTFREVDLASPRASSRCWNVADYVLRD